MPFHLNNDTVYHLEDIKYVPSLNSCINFDGLSEFATFTTMPAINYMSGDYTIELWIKDFGSQYNYGDHNFILFNYYVRLSIYQKTMFDWTTMALPLFNDFYIPFSSIPGFNAAQWLHIVLRFKTAGFKKEFICNTHLVNSQGIGKIGSGPDNVFSLGSYYIGSGNTPRFNYKGKMDEFRLYTRAISDAEIAYSYNGGQGNFPMNTAGLALWYGFEKKTKNLGSAGGAYNLQLYNYITSPYVNRIGG